MHPSVVLLAWPSFEPPHQRLVSRGHPFQARLHRGAVGEREEPLGPGAQLPRRLRPAQQQHGENRALVICQIEALRKCLVILQGAPSGVGPHDA